MQNVSVLRRSLLVMLAVLSVCWLSIPLAGAQTLTTLATFNPPNGYYPTSTPTLSSDGSTIYGTTTQGGSHNLGTVFSVPVTGGTPTILLSFDGSNGSRPEATVTLSKDGSTLYGTAYSGGAYGYGTVFSLPVTGGTPSILENFNGTDGANPVDSPTLSSDGSTLYGTTYAGGYASLGGFVYGTVFSIPVTGGTITTLAQFNGTDGAEVYSGVILVGGSLYGTSMGYGAYGYGTVFSIPITGGGFPTSLVNFGNGIAQNPFCGVTLSKNGDILYGATGYGGAYNHGAVYAAFLTGGYAGTLASFNGNDGIAVNAVTLSSDGNTLYGTTYGGGAYGLGTVFSVPVAGGTPTTLWNFNGTNGDSPYAGVTLSKDGGTLYGTTDNGGNPGYGTVFALTIGGGPATHFSVTTPANETAGTLFNYTVTALNSGGKVVTGYNGTVHFISTDGAAVLSGDSTLSSGTGSLYSSFTTAGSQTITATDTVTPSITGTSNATSVFPGAATHLKITASASATAGAAFVFAVTALDAGGNIATSYNGTVHFTSSDGAAILPANATLSNGLGSFSATLKTAGNQTISATDTSTSTITGSTNSIAIAGTATHFKLTVPASVSAGNSFSYTVTALDTFSNIATGYTGTIHFTATDGSASLPANATLANGVGSFSAILKAAGLQTLSATDVVTAGITGTSSSITTASGAVTHLSVATPASATAGTAFNSAVTALDNFNNTVTSYAGTVHFTSTDAAALLPATAVLTHGTGSFGVTLETAGSQTISATDTVIPSTTGTSGTISVSAGAATHFKISTPGSATAGTPFSFTVTAQDSFNNTTSSYTGIVHFTSTDGAAILPANAVLTNGAGSFSATLKTSGSETITATDTVSSSITGASGAIAVGSSAATHYNLNAPTNATSGTSFTFTVTALDAFNNTATGYGGTTHFTSTDVAAILPANTILTNGAGSFSATLKTFGSQTITATDTATASITGTSGSITVIPATLHTFAAGAIMISAPVNDSSFSLVQEFNGPVNLAVWNPSTFVYTLSPTSPANTLMAGQGYWARFASATNLFDLHTTVPPTQPVSVSLVVGWNLIGNPRTTAIAGSALTFKTASKSYTLAAATTAGLVYNNLDTWQAGDTQYEIIPGASSSLQPYYGYWIYAYKACTLVYP